MMRLLTVDLVWAAGAALLLSVSRSVATPGLGEHLMEQGTGTGARLFGFDLHSASRPSPSLGHHSAPAESQRPTAAPSSSAAEATSRLVVSGGLDQQHPDFVELFNAKKPQMQRLTRILIDHAHVMRLRGTRAEQDASDAERTLHYLNVELQNRRQTVFTPKHRALLSAKDPSSLNYEEQAMRRALMEKHRLTSLRSERRAVEDVAREHGWRIESGKEASDSHLLQQMRTAELPGYPAKTSKGLEKALYRATIPMDELRRKEANMRARKMERRKEKREATAPLDPPSKLTKIEGSSSTALPSSP